jgi:hypothetical protein
VLNTDTVLKFIDLEESKRKEKEKSEDKDPNKKSLLETAALYEQEIAFGGGLGASLIKTEVKGEPEKTNAVVQFVMTTQESQKDFLFDPYAAAYYERFQGFIPGEKILDFK